MIKIRIIVKFGGTSIQDKDRIERAAQSILKKVKEGAEIIVVVSAMGDTTDDLIDLLGNVTNHSFDKADYAGFVSFGERMSAQLMSTSLKSRGLKSYCFEPAKEDFPIITNELNILEAKIDSQRSKEQCRKYLEPLLKEGITPVVCGFLGRGEQTGNITCLGRGGSDITAFALGNFLSADEVIIVTDASGVASADPRLIKKVEMLTKISVEEMGILAEGGAQVLHPRALNFKEGNMKAKIIHFQNGNLDSTGTEIEGSFSSHISIFEEKISLLTVVGDKILETAGLLKDVITPLAKNRISIQGIATGRQYIGIYLLERFAKKAYDLVHPIVLKSDNLKSVTIKSDIALVIASSRNFIDTPGIIETIAHPLAKHHINILEMTTIKTDIMVFVSWQDREMTYDLIKDSLSDTLISTSE